MSIHTWKSFEIAKRNGAWSATNERTWKVLTALSKRELVEVVIRLGAQLSDDDTGEDVESALQRVLKEARTLRANRII